LSRLGRRLEYDIVDQSTATFDGEQQRRSIPADAPLVHHPANLSLALV
jgi:hypothetical protein